VLTPLSTCLLKLQVHSEATQRHPDLLSIQDLQNCLQSSNVFALWVVHMTREFMLDKECLCTHWMEKKAIKAEISF
jgi:hypothetical protein